MLAGVEKMEENELRRCQAALLPTRNVSEKIDEDILIPLWMV